MASGHAGMMSQICSCVVISENMVNDPFISITDRMIMVRDTLYEIVCVTARSAPIRAHLEFDDQPDHRMAYMDRLEVARISRILKFMLIKGCGIGNGIHIMRVRVSARVGTMENSSGEEACGRMGSLINSFSALANGWRML
jgi:hypothetical protein